MLKNRLVKCLRCPDVIQEADSILGLCSKCDCETREIYKSFQEKNELINKKIHELYKLTQKLND
jgi:NMD protein affecting ribosome stability and mRNA decay